MCSTPCSHIVPSNRPYILPLMRIHLELDNIIYRLCKISAAFVGSFSFVLMRWVEFCRHSVLCCLVPIRNRDLAFLIFLLQTQSWFTHLEMAMLHIHVFHASLSSLKLWFEKVQTPEINIMFSFLQMQTYNHLCKIKPRTDVYLPALIAAFWPY